MIKSIELINYECHKRSKINLVGPGVNVIKGDNDSGKSSFTRAVHEIVTNPGGDDCISNWCKKSETSKIIVETMEGNVTEKEKGKQVNIYTLNGKVLEAFGRNVPEKVKKALNMNISNIQFQEDRAFLLSDTSGAIARFLNQTVDLDIIDRSHSNIEKRKREVRSQNASLSSRKKELNQELENFSNLDRLENKVENLERKETQLQNSVKKQREISLLITEIQAARSELKEYRDITQYEAKINHLIEKYEKLREDLSKQEEIAETLDSLRDLRDDKLYYQEITKHETKIKRLWDKWEKLEQLKRGIKEIKGIKDDLVEAKKEYYKLKENIKDYAQKLKKLMPKICPLCDQEIKEKK